MPNQCKICFLEFARKKKPLRHVLSKTLPWKVSLVQSRSATRDKQNNISGYSGGTPSIDHLHPCRCRRCGTIPRKRRAPASPLLKRRRRVHIAAETCTSSGNPNRRLRYTLGTTNQQEDGHANNSRGTQLRQIQHKHARAHRKYYSTICLPSFCLAGDTSVLATSDAGAVALYDH